MDTDRLYHFDDSRPDVDEGIDWELEHHVSERIDELVAQGYSVVAAREEALRSFGNMKHVRRELLEIDRRVERRRAMVRMIDDVVQDIRYGLRSIRLNPGISLGVILTLALGIGANAAMFSVVDALLLRPLPYAAPDELFEVNVLEESNDYPWRTVPYEVARSWQDRGDYPVMLHNRLSALYTGGIEAEAVTIQAVTPSFSELFGVSPILGRGFLPEDGDPSSPDVVLLDHDFWRESLAGDPNVTGTSILLNGSPHTIVGVMPKGFRFPAYATTQGWVPIRTAGVLPLTPGEPVRISMTGMLMRVPAEAQRAVAEQAATVGSALFRTIDPSSTKSFVLESLNANRGGNSDTRQAMILLSGAVALILLVAGANMVNLLLARGSARTGEIAIRMAVGAARGRIVRQIATEAIVLALLGGIAAAGLAVCVVRGFQGILPGEVTFFAPHAIAIERRTMLFTFLVAVASGLVFGLIPALAATGWARQRSSAALTRYAGRTGSGRRLRRGLVVAEIAFSMMLLVTASLLINSFVRLMRVDPGMRLDGMAVLTFTVSSTMFPESADRDSYLRRIEQRISALPAVESVAITGGLPPMAGRLRFGIELEAEDQPPIPRDLRLVLPETDVGTTFFDVTGTRLVAGRPFAGAGDRRSGNVIIDEDLAMHLWPGSSAIGRRFRLDPDADWMTVTGVMADLRLLGPDERKGDFAIVYPLDDFGDLGHVALAIRTRGDMSRVLRSVRAAVHEVNPDQPIQDLMPATSYYSASIDMPRFLTMLMGMLAMLALILAAVGMHGVLAFGVAQRRHEIGVRMVLGARSAELRRLVVGEGLMLATLGIALGIAGALLGTRIVQGVLYGVDASDPLTFAAAIALVLIIAAAATLRPAQRAARLDPLEVIRAQ